MAVLFFNFWEKNPELYLFKRKYFVVLIMALGFVALVGVLWELYEFGLDYSGLFPFKSQQGLQDTMLDLFWDLAGGGFLLLFFLNSSLYKKYLPGAQEKI